MKDIVTSGLTSPVGIGVYGDRLIVTDNGTDEIIIYDIANNYVELGRIKLKYSTNPDPMGIKIGPDGKIYFADKVNKKVYLIEKKLVGLDEGYSPATRMYLSQKGIEVYSQLVDVVNKQIGGQ